MLWGSLYNIKYVLITFYINLSIIIYYINRVKKVHFPVSLSGVELPQTCAALLE